MSVKHHFPDKKIAACNQNQWYNINAAYSVIKIQTEQQQEDITQGNFFINKNISQIKQRKQNNKKYRVKNQG